MLVDDELQHLALSKILGNLKVPYKIRRGFRTWGARVLGERRGPVPYLQGLDVTISVTDSESEPDSESEARSEPAGGPGTCTAAL